MAGAIVVGALLAITRASSTVIDWEHRRRQAKALAKLDAKIAALETAPRRIEGTSLEDARVRIAELEAEEALAVEDAE